MGELRLCPIAPPFPLSRDPAALERRARQIQNVAVFIQDPLVYDETLARARAMLDEAKMLRQRANTPNRQC